MRGLKLLSGAGLAALALATAGAVPTSAQPSASASVDTAKCAGLKGSKVGHGVVESSEVIAAGTVLKEAMGMSLKAKMPFCRVKARVSPVAGSDIKVEVWLPATWNGKLMGVGGGGFTGGLDSAAVSLPPLLEKGFAAVATDVGHDASEHPEWAIGSPQKVEDYGHRGNHEAALVAKATIATFYGAGPSRSYFHGCSNGGRDALMLAQRYPEDYDGIVAGAPANNIVPLATSFVWQRALLKQAPDLDKKLELVTDEVIRQCDALDGVKDGVLENPNACDFNPEPLRCKSGGGSDCLSDAELAAVVSIHRGPSTSSGRKVHAGLPVGSEHGGANWSAWITGAKPAGGSLGVDFFRYFVFEKPDWNPDSFQLDREYALVMKRFAPVLDAADTDLRPFIRRGGKLIIYHGWNDAAIGAGNTLDYYARVKERLGSDANQTRLFMAPGMNHCIGGEGPSFFDMPAEMDRWFETGKAPDRVVATKYENPIFAFLGLPTKVTRTRPLCAWPMTAHYKGSGSTDDEANFVCRLPAK